MTMIITTPAARRYIYGISIAAIAVLVVLGLVSEDQTQVWLNLVAAILGLGNAGLALPNTSPASPGGPLDPLGADRVPGGPDHRADGPATG